MRRASSAPPAAQADAPSCTIVPERMMKELREHGGRGVRAACPPRPLGGRGDARKYDEHALNEDGDARVGALGRLGGLARCERDARAHVPGGVTSTRAGKRRGGERRRPAGARTVLLHHEEGCAADGTDADEQRGEHEDPRLGARVAGVGIGCLRRATGPGGGGRAARVSGGPGAGTSVRRCVPAQARTSRPIWPQSTALSMMNVMVTTVPGSQEYPDTSFVTLFSVFRPYAVPSM